MQKEREITIKFIQNNKTKYHRLADFFARKYCEKNTNIQNKKNTKS